MWFSISISLSPMLSHATSLLDRAPEGNLGNGAHRTLARHYSAADPKRPRGLVRQEKRGLAALCVLLLIVSLLFFCFEKFMIDGFFAFDGRRACVQ